jgi:hypothetical protein
MLSELFAQHPPPWSLGDLDDIAADPELSEWRQQIVDANGHEIAATTSTIADEAIALARVIAALPELLTSNKQAWNALLGRKPGSVPGGEEACEALLVALDAAGVTEIER